MYVRCLVGSQPWLRGTHEVLWCSTWKHCAMKTWTRNCSARRCCYNLPAMSPISG